jgi:hypothetical protein
MTSKHGVRIQPDGTGRCTCGQAFEGTNRESITKQFYTHLISPQKMTPVEGERRVVKSKATLTFGGPYNYNKALR